MIIRISTNKKGLTKEKKPYLLYWTSNVLYIVLGYFERLPKSIHTYSMHTQRGKLGQLYTSRNRHKYVLSISNGAHTSTHSTAINISKE